jgi:diguanylate cyclase (GGDEF)-like protein
LCWLGVPLNSHKGTIGVLVLKSYSGGAHYTEKHKELLQFVSTQVATAIERKQLYDRLQYAARYDELTGLPNRGLLHDHLETVLARTRRQQGRMSLLYLDLDKFKQVNDSFGHAAGDLLLQKVANRLKQCVRDADTVARIGGDEFVVLLENIQLPEHVSVVAEKIRKVLNQTMNIDGHRLRIMPSIGIAHHPDHGDSAQQLLKHADEAMYLAKKNRDNRFQARGEPNCSDDGADTESPA